jgi:hypothetical protein
MTHVTLRVGLAVLVRLAVVPAISWPGTGVPGVAPIDCGVAAVRTVASGVDGLAAAANCRHEQAPTNGRREHQYAT